MVVDLLKRNEELEHEVGQLHDTLKDLEAKLATSEQERQLLARILRNLNARIYGKSSEKLAPGQLTFDFCSDLVEEAKAEVDEEKLEEEFADDDTSPPRRKRKKSRTIPKDAKRERIVLDVDPELRVCSGCDCEMQKIGEDVTTELDYIPAQFIAREYVRPKYACRTCQDGVLQEELPKRPIKKGFPGVGLLVHILVAKYVDHQPLYRLEKAFRRQGAELPRSTLCDWVQAMAKLLQPIWEALKREVLAASLIQADETPVKVLNKQGVKKGYLWTYGIPWQEVVFDFTEGRGGIFADEFLGDYAGKLQCDAYSGYDRLERKEIVRLGCWAHARRRFYDARGETKTARIGLAGIQSLYRLERQAREDGLSGEALVEFRREHAKPVLEKLHAYFEEKPPGGASKVADGRRDSVRAQPMGDARALRRCGGSRYR
jgi:transposase